MMMVNRNHKHNANYHDSNKQDVDDMHDYDKEYVSFCDELTSLLVSHFYECCIFGSGISSSEGLDLRSFGSVDFGLEIKMNMIRLRSTS